MSVFSFLVTAGFEPTSLSLGGGRFNRYPILTPPLYLEEGGGGGTASLKVATRCQTAAPAFQALLRITSLLKTSLYRSSLPESSCGLVAWRP